MKITRLLPFLLLAILASAATITRAATLPAAEDSSSSRGKLTAATNRATTLRVDATHNGFVYFDLSAVPANTAAQIRYARLRLYLPKVTANGGGLTVHVVTSPWDEAVPTVAPSHDPAVAATIGALTLRSKRFVSVDVTAAVQAWVAGSAANDGFAILSVSGTNVLVSAKEGSGTGYPAELDVELNPDGGSITSAQLADNLTLGGTTSGTFSGDGGALLGLNGANLAAGSVTGTQLGSNLTLNGTTSGTFSGDGSGLANVALPAYGYFYLVATADMLIPAGADIPFPNNGPVIGIVRNTASVFVLPTVGVYEISWQVGIGGAGQLELVLNGDRQSSTVVGRQGASSQIVGNVLIETTVANSTLSLRNPIDNATQLDIQAHFGGSIPNTGSLVIKRIK